MTDNIKRGKEGEQLTEDFLKEKGYVVLERNYRYKKSEIDLVVSQDNWLIFVEVKTRSSNAFGYPEDFVEKSQQEKIFEGALHYMDAKDWLGNVRYDIVAVDLSTGIPEITHIEDAFY